jgi:hypothetical protein
MLTEKYDFPVNQQGTLQKSIHKGSLTEILFKEAVKKNSKASSNASK